MAHAHLVRAAVIGVGLKLIHGVPPSSKCDFLSGPAASICGVRPPNLAKRRCISIMDSGVPLLTQRLRSPVRYHHHRTGNLKEDLG